MACSCCMAYCKKVVAGQGIRRATTTMVAGKVEVASRKPVDLAYLDSASAQPTSCSAITDCMQDSLAVATAELTG